MSFSYDLDIATCLTAQEVITAVCGIPGAVTTEKGILVGPIYVTARQMALAYTSSVVGNWLAATPTVSVELDVQGAAEDFDRNVDIVVRTTAHILTQVPGNAALSYDHDVIYLLRLDSRLIANARRELMFWTPSRLALLGSRYEWANL
jgi:hypothetical protein